MRTPSATRGLALVTSVVEEYARILMNPSHPDYTDTQARIQAGRTKLMKGLLLPSERAAADMKSGTLSPELAEFVATKQTG